MLILFSLILIPFCHCGEVLPLGGPKTGLGFLDRPSPVPGHLITQPFVPEEFRWNTDILNRNLIEFTNDTEQTEGMKESVLDALNSNTTLETYSDLTYSYAGKEDSGENRTSFVMRVGVQVCSKEEIICLPKDCKLEFESTSEQLTMTKRDCVVGILSLQSEEDLCYFCDRSKGIDCPEIDLIGDTTRYRDKTPNAFQRCNTSESENRTLACFTRYTEVAGLRTYLKIGCHSTTQNAEPECRADSHEYSHFCTCSTTLCNNPYLPAENLSAQLSADARMALYFRQLKAHLENQIQENYEEMCDN